MAEVESAPAQAQASPSAPAGPPSRAEIIARATEALTPPAPDAAPASSPATEAKPALPSTPEAPATEAVLAQEESRSALIRQRNELLDARKALDAERASWRKEQAQAKAQAEAMARALADFEADPAAFAKLRGDGKRSLMDLARDLYIEDAEIDKLPPEQAAPLKAERELMRMRREQTKMQAQIEASRQENRLALYRGQLAAGLSQLGDDTPLVKALAASDAGMVVTQLERVAGQLAQKRPELGLQTASQLASLLEPELAKQLEDTSTRFKDWFGKRFAQAAPAQQAVATGAAKKSEDKTLSRDLTSATPARSGKLTAGERLELAKRTLEGRA